MHSWIGYGIFPQDCDAELARMHREEGLSSRMSLHLTWINTIPFRTMPSKAIGNS